MTMTVRRRFQQKNADGFTHDTESRSTANNHDNQNGDNSLMCNFQHYTCNSAMYFLRESIDEERDPPDIASKLHFK